MAGKNSTPDGPGRAMVTVTGAPGQAGRKSSRPNKNGGPEAAARVGEVGGQPITTVNCS